MPLLRVPLDALGPGARTLDEKTARYVTRVHRLSAGDRFLAFDPSARTEAEVTIERAGKRVECAISAVRPSTAPAADRVTLLQCLGKGDKPEHVISAATALGVERIVFVASARSVVAPGERGTTRLGRYRTVAVEAARQCGRGDVPELAGPTGLPEALAFAPDGLRVCLAPGADASLADVLGTREGRPLTLLVGPEGGLAAEELELCRATGFAFAALGAHVLRTELAAVAALGAVAAFSRGKGATLGGR